MRKSVIVVISALLLLIIIDGVIINILYQNQLSKQKSLLAKQLETCSNNIETEVSRFESDLNFILFSDDISELFSDNFQESGSLRKLEMFYSSYTDMIKNIDIYDNNKNVLNLFKDKKGNFISDKYLAQRQKKLADQESVKTKDSEYQYFIPVFKNNEVYGNIVISIDLSQYIISELYKFHIPNVIYQYVIDPETGSFKSNYQGKVTIDKIEIISENLRNEIGDVIEHQIKSDSIVTLVTTVYAPLKALDHKFGLAFCIDKNFFIKSVLEKVYILCILTFIIIGIVILYFIRSFKTVTQANSDLQNEITLIKYILENLPIGILIFDDSLKISTINQVAREMLQVKEGEEKTGNSLTQKFLQASRPNKRKEISAAYDSNHFILYQKEGNEIILYKKEFPSIINGKELIISAFIDITPLEKARKYEAAMNNAKSEFLAKMSHEIRTPMNGIIGMTDALNKNNLTKEQAEYIDIVKRSADLLLSIIDDILDHSKIEAGKMQLEELPFKLIDEIKLSLDLFRSIIDEKGLKLSIHIDENVPENIIGDPFRLRQVLSNFISNAVKFTHEGEIRLVVKIEEEYNGNVSLLFEVADTGVGIPKERMESIFNSFTQAENSTSRKYGGSGLGTTIAKQLINLMNGEVWVESPSGISKNKKYPGSKFSFTIEVFSNNDIKKDLNYSLITSFNQINVFLITQNVTTKKRLTGFLKHIGVNLEIATIDEEILPSIKKQLEKGEKQYHLVIIMDEPNLDGIWIARQLNQSGLTDKYRFIMISSNHKQENYIQTKLAKIDFYMTQPFEQDILKNYLYRCFNSLNIESITKEISLQKDLNILVAEDNLINQKVAESIFMNMGYKIDIAIDGKEVVDMIKKKPYDIVFMDLQMPEKDGVDATVEIRGLGYQMPIVAMTATASKIGKDSALTSGMNDYITKPVKTEAVRSVMEKWFA
jgi:signal transduction histidine kinase/CheY-like chemotaxis protein